MSDDDFASDLDSQNEYSQPAIDTGQVFSPLARYLDDLQIRAKTRGEKLQFPPPGPAVRMASSIVEEFRRTRLEEQGRKVQARERRLRPIREREDEEYHEVLHRVVGEVLKTREKRKETEKYMAERAKRIKIMRFPDGRLRYAGRPVEYAKLMPPWLLEKWAWDMIDKTYWHGELGWKVGQESWDEYVDHVKGWQKRVYDKYKDWIRSHVKLRRYPVWVDENATYRVKDRRRAYRDRMLFKVTYHSVGILHFHLPSPPRFIPRPPKKFQIEPIVCFQCEAKGLPKRCVVLRGGCKRCRRTGDECLSLDLLDIEEARKYEDGEVLIRAWFVPGYTVKGFEGDDDQTRMRKEKEAQKRRRWFEKGRFEVMEHVGGELGFVKRNVKSQSWALPAWERDENGKIIPRAS